MRRIAALLLLCALFLSARADEVVAPPPAGAVTWGAEPVEEQGPYRAQVCLNGLWRFRPERDGRAGSWGWIRVPGAWAAQERLGLPGVVVAGEGPAWEGLRGGQAGKAWGGLRTAGYARDLAIPAAWAGRRITIEFQRIATDAAVAIDGRPAGRLASPGGLLDITALVQAGRTHALSVQVEAAEAGEPVTVFMGAAPDQVFTRKAPLPARGLIGDVLLASAPRGPALAEVAVRTSTRQGRIDLGIELAEATGDGELAVEARLLDGAGRCERTFTGAARVRAGRVEPIGWAWADARRWDLGRPELYTLALRARGLGLGIDDELHVRFGFREFWIDGRDCYLNGSRVRLRPAVMTNTADRDWGVVELIDGALDGLKAAGFDSQEMWPWDQAERGAPRWHHLWYARAAERGWGIIGALPSIAQLMGPKWRDPAARAAWEAATAAEIRRHRNNPAILVWVHSPNIFGHWRDQDPRLIGRPEAIAPLSRADGKNLDPGLEANAAIRRLDPSRPVTTHHGGAVGDLHTVNTYPCLSPQQEQEEWLSAWAESGQVPYWAVEFGPFILDYRRGRLSGGWGQAFGAIHTESLLTEHLAAAYGAEAYRAEEAAERRLNAAHLVQGQTYRPMPVVIPELAERHMAEQLAGVYRAWRSLGAAILPIPWEFEQGWRRGVVADGGEAADTETLGLFRPGRRGIYLPAARRERLHWLQAGGATPRARGLALPQVNGPTLAWIAGADRPGDRAAFTAKDHVYAPGGALAKQAILVNDTRAEAAFALRWRVLVDGVEVARGAETGAIPTGAERRLPIACTLPAGRSGHGAIALDAEIAGVAHQDTFAFRILAAPAPLGLTVAAVDPAGDTRRLLAAAGCTLAGDRPADGRLFVVGRNALASGALAWADLEAPVRAGARVLVMAQDPQWMRDALGWRVGYRVERRVFALAGDHPVLAGLEADDLRDWAGSGSLVDPRPAVGDGERSQSGYPRHGWRWGTRGSLSSAMIEKPHRGAWRPLIEGDYDLAYTPLMEQDLGRGRIVWCTLDLEARGADEPAAATLFANLLRYAAEAPLPGRAGAARYLGGDEDRAFVANHLGVELGAAGLLIAGRGADPAAVQRHLAAGGSALCLDAAAAGLAVEERLGAAAPVVPAWGWCRGMSPSDLRLRADLPLPRLRPAAGWELAADGLLAQRRVAGGGLLAVCLLDPRRLDADRLTYLRQTRWRWTHALSLALANLGAGFSTDAAQFRPRAVLADLPLAGAWAARLTAPLAPAASAERGHDDPGASAAARAAADPAYDDAAWERQTLPAAWEAMGPAWRAADGEAVFRRRVALPTALRGRALTLELGAIDDCDTVWVNGVQVGATGVGTPQYWKAVRRYPVPAALTAGDALVIVIRVFDRYGGAQVGSAPSSFRLIPLRATDAAPGDWYHPDWIDDFALSDDPHRYYRW